MKLTKFKEKESNKKVVIISTGVLIILALVLVVFSYSLYQKEDEVQFVNGTVGEFCIECTVNFDANGGSVEQTSKIVRNKEEYGELPIPTRPHRRFLGWYTDTNYTTQVTPTSKVELTRAQTLYAKWQLYNVFDETDITNFYAIERNTGIKSSAWDRIANSESLEANAQIGTTTVKNDFDNIYPWSDIKSYNYDTGTKKITAWYGESGFTFTPTGNVEVLTYIPEFYYARYQIEDYEYIAISDHAQEGFTKSEAFSIGRYTMSGSSSRVHSRSGAQPLASHKITEFRTYARNLGSGFGQLDYHYFIIQLLYLVEYADYNSQSKLGLGSVSNTVAIASGGCNELGMKSGTLNNDGKHSVIYRGIEDIYGNIWQIVDGINIKDHQVYINYNPATYQVDTYSGDYKKIGYVNSSSNGWITKLGYDAGNPLVAFPIEVSGNYYIPDCYYPATGNRIPVIGGRWLDGREAGLWWFFGELSSNAWSAFGARLLKTS